MVFKLCKYQCNTEIQWDNEDSLFREHDGRAHDRPRCESIRKKNGTSTVTNTTFSSTANQSTQQVQTESGRATYDVAQKLDKIQAQLDLLPAISQKLTVLHEIYSDLLDHYKADKQNRALAEQEARYDQDKEEGLV